MKVDRLIALEIYGNQDDIVCEFVGEDEKGNLVGVIRRGPGHDGKWLLSAGFDPTENDENTVVSYMKFLRDDIIDFVKKDLADEDSETSQLLQDESIQVAMEIVRMSKEGNG